MLTTTSIKPLGPLKEGSKAWDKINIFAHNEVMCTICKTTHVAIDEGTINFAIYKGLPVVLNCCGAIFEQEENAEDGK